MAKQSFSESPKISETSPKSNISQIEDFGATSEKEAISPDEVKRKNFDSQILQFVRGLKSFLGK